MDSCGLRSVRAKNCFKTKQMCTLLEEKNAAGVPTEMQEI